MTDLRRQSAKDYIASAQAQAAAQFTRHVIRSRTDRSWLVQKPYVARDGIPRIGEWDSDFWFEVFATHGQKLFLHGDIDHVLFAYSNRGDDPEQTLRWMGQHSDLAYYILQKAAIGMGGRGGADLCLETLDEAVWLDQALDYVETNLFDERPATPLDPNKLDFELLPIPDWLKTMIERLAFGVSIEEVVDINQTWCSEAYEAGAFDWGKVPSTRLIYAHEGLKTLVRLLDAERTQTEVTSVGG